MTKRTMAKRALKKATLTFSTTTTSNAAPSSQRHSSTAGKSKGKRPRSPIPEENPYGIEFKNEEQKLRYVTLSKRSIIPTRYLDEHTLGTLGMLEDVNWLLHRLGWDNFVTLKYPSYEKITIEFLSSVNSEILQRKNCEHGLITFRLHNRDLALTLAEFNLIFRLPCGGERNYPHEFQAAFFWSQISGYGDFVSSESKESYIHNPCFRYVHRLMNHTIFARGDSNSHIRKSEMLLLWGMANAVDLDSGSWLARQFTKVGKAVSGQIAIGGLITPIARHFNISLDGDKPILGTSRIDFEMLVNNEMLVKRDDHYYLVMSDNLKMPPQSLPNPEITMVRGKQIWLFHHSENQEDQINVPLLEHSSEFSSIPVGPHANDFSRLHESIPALQAQ